MITLKSIEPSKRKDKKYVATFEVDGKIKKTNFGSSGMSDFTINKDIDRRNRYIARHTKDLKTNDPTRAGYLSLAILWSKPTIKQSVAFYKELLKDYNKDKNIVKLKNKLLNP
jgi:hypothetical protein